MQIVIDIPEKMYENALNNLLCGSTILCNAIKNGTPLPKGHGRLIDESLMNDDNVFSILEDDGTFYRNETSLPTVVPADEEGEDDAETDKG